MSAQRGFLGPPSPLVRSAWTASRPSSTTTAAARSSRSRPAAARPPPRPCSRSSPPSTGPSPSTAFPASMSMPGRTCRWRGRWETSSRGSRRWRRRGRGVRRPPRGGWRPPPCTAAWAPSCTWCGRRRRTDGYSFQLCILIPPISRRLRPAFLEARRRCCWSYGAGSRTALRLRAGRPPVTAAPRHLPPAASSLLDGSGPHHVLAANSVPRPFLHDGALSLGVIDVAGSAGGGRRLYSLPCQLAAGMAVSFTSSPLRIRAHAPCCARFFTLAPFLRVA